MSVLEDERLWSDVGLGVIIAFVLVVILLAAAACRDRK
jgi:hypothetical protein